MEELKTSARNLKEHVSEYAKTYAELIKAKTTQGASNAAASAAVMIAATFFSIFFLSFLFLGLAWWIGTALDSPAAGFFIVAGLFLLIVVLLFVLRKKVIIPMIRNALIASVYAQKEEKHDGQENQNLSGPRRREATANSLTEDTGRTN
ncbi:MAG: phage holin family protein [Bacteroidota bacterium]|nr:phage holin family protein [Bacteroidota bacterium]